MVHSKVVQNWGKLDQVLIRNVQDKFLGAFINALTAKLDIINTSTKNDFTSTTTTTTTKMDTAAHIKSNIYISVFFVLWYLQYFDINLAPGVLLQKKLEIVTVRYYTIH